MGDHSILFYRYADTLLSALMLAKSIVLALRLRGVNTLAFYSLGDQAYQEKSYSPAQGDRHAAVLEGGGRVHALELKVEAGAYLFGEVRSLYKGCVALA